MEKKIKTALASYGMSGQVFHGPLIKVNPHFELISVLERSKTISKTLFPDASIVKTFDDILDNPEAELVVVNTPDEHHYEMIEKALNAGKNVVAEKPVTQKRVQAEKLFNLAEKKGVLLTVFQNRRLDGDFLTVKKVLEQGLAGRLVEFESHYDRYRDAIDTSSWKEHGGDYSGVLFNLGSHMVDQVVVLFGRPLAVTAHLKVVRSGGHVHDYYDIRLEYDGFAALLKCSYLVKEPGPRYSFHGDKGSFHKWGIDPQEELLKKGKLPEGNSWGIDDEANWAHLVYEKDGLTCKGRIPTLPGNYNLYYDNLYKVLRKGEQPLVRPHEVLSVLGILEACLESNRHKKTILLDTGI